MAVRLGVKADEAQIMGLCRMLHEENGLFPMADHHVLEMLQTGFPGPGGEMPKGGLIGVIEGADGNLEACIFMVMQRMWYSEQWFLEECFSFVHPQARAESGKGHAGQLIDFAKMMSDRIGIPLVIGVISNQRTQAKVKLYQRRLGAPAGAFFLYGARTGQVSDATLRGRDGVEVSEVRHLDGVLGAAERGSEQLQ